jgi:uncharacterized protein YxjI
MPVSEIADRYSITLLKHQRTDLDLSKELDAYQRAVRKYYGIDAYLERLVEINGQIWDLESDIRRGKEGELGLEEVGRRALLIRDKNAVRIAIKNEIAAHYREGFIERKKDHAST